MKHLLSIPPNATVAALPANLSENALAISAENFCNLPPSNPGITLNNLDIVPNTVLTILLTIFITGVDTLSTPCIILIPVLLAHEPSPGAITSLASTAFAAFIKLVTPLASNLAILLPILAAVSIESTANPGIPNNILGANEPILYFHPYLSNRALSTAVPASLAILPIPVPSFHIPEPTVPAIAAPFIAPSNPIPAIRSIIPF